MPFVCPVVIIFCLSGVVSCPLSLKVGFVIIINLLQKIWLCIYFKEIHWVISLLFAPSISSLFLSFAIIFFWGKALKAQLLDKDSTIKAELLTRKLGRSFTIHHPFNLNKEFKLRLSSPNQAGSACIGQNKSITVPLFDFLFFFELGYMKC